MPRLPRLVRFLLLSTSVGVAALLLLRLVFFAVFNNGADPVPAMDLLRAFYLGLKFDLRVVLVLTLPLALLGWIRTLSPFEQGYARLLWTAYLWIATLLLALFYVFDFGHYAYLATRLNIGVLRFLDNAEISMQMVWESYPVAWISLGLTVFMTVAGYGIQRAFARLSAQPAPVLRWRTRLAIGAVATVAILGGLYGKLSWYPLRWSDAYFSPHGFATALAVNPLHYFIDTRKNGGVRYEERKVREHYSTMAAYLGLAQPDAQSLRFDRTVTPVYTAMKRPNVVVVQIESFASYKNSLSGNPLDPTPKFAAIAREGIYFPNFFVPHTGTAHAVFATTTGTPDVELNGTSSRNPVVVNQHILMADFEGYEKFYFLGGSASWGNIRGLLAHNIPGLHIYEEGGYKSPRVDVWGISDLSLFDEANQILRAQDKPFFAYIQTSGGHRPYTIPADNRGFEAKHSGDNEVLKYGFISEAEYNSYRFMDHAIGWFMDAAKKEQYFDNTLFVFFGDHGLGGNAGQHVTAAETQLDLNAYRVPLVIYAPRLLAPQTLTKVGSQVDILPTVARLAGMPYTITTLGRDLLDPSHDQHRYAFTIDHNRRLIGLIGDGFVFQMENDGRQPRLYRMDNPNPREDVAPAYPAQAARMKELTLAIYESSKYMLHHNSREGSTHMATRSMHP